MTSWEERIAAEVVRHEEVLTSRSAEVAAPRASFAAVPGRTVG
jgi:hypothetical protein